MSSGAARIAWADAQMPVLRSIRERFALERPLAGLSVGACLHVTAETACLVRALAAGGARVAVAAANPLSTQDDVVAALAGDEDVAVHARWGEDADAYVANVVAVADAAPVITLDDGADLITFLHARGLPDGMLGGTEETTAGLVRLRQSSLSCPVLALNEAATERIFNDHYGTGQSALDGILRATGILLAGQTFVVVGYGATGRGIADRARGAGAQVIVCEVDPLRALEARMEGFEVMPLLDAAARGSVFVTATGSREVLRGEHFARMGDGAILANAGHFDVEVSLPDLLAAADGPPTAVLELVDEYLMADGRRLNLLASGRVVNLAAGDGHPASVMDISFAAHALAAEHLARHGATLPDGVQPVPDLIDREVARLKLAALGVRIDALTASQLSYRGA